MSTAIPSRQPQTDHVRTKAASLSSATDQGELSSRELAYLDDLMALERWVKGEVQGCAAAICCHQLAKRLRTDLHAIEAELLTPDEIQKRKTSTNAGERRRRGYAQAHRRAAAAGIRPR